MRLRHFLLVIALILFQPTAQSQVTKIGESEYFEFYSNYWLNLHHFLNQEALVKEVSGKSILTAQETAALSKDQRETLDKVVEYYRKNLHEEDLRMSDFMTDFKHWITSNQNGTIFENIPDQFKGLCTELSKVSRLYENLFWNDHKLSNRKALSQNLELVKKIEAEVVSKLSTQTRERWQSKKIRVDICSFAKATSWNLRDRPYTSLYPTHIVMNSKNGLDTPGNWVEMLFHEASHHLIGSRTGFVGGTIEDVASNLGVESPRSLWHAYLFYFSGATVKAAIEKQGISDYELYMKRNRVFASLIPALDEFMPAYLNGKASLAEVTLKIIQSQN